MNIDKFTFTLTEAEANLIVRALSELPLKTSLDLFTKLKAQAQAQEQVPEPVKGPQPLSSSSKKRSVS